MESGNDIDHLEDDDRLSKLPDDMLLYILEKESIVTSIRASFSSTRWRHLPAGLLHINISIWDFLPPSKIFSINDTEIDEAMSAMTKAARICLAAPGRGSTIKTVSLRLCLTSSYLHDIGELVGKAIDNNEVKTVELALPTSKDSLDCDMTDMVQHANNLICFIATFPNLLRCITRLDLYNARFSKLQMCHLLNSCEQLQHMELNNCDTGDLSTLKINMPNSTISRIRLHSCLFEKIDFLCLPKLAVLYCESWFTSNAPLSFGYTPCLEELSLVLCAKRNQSGLSLSELLHGSVELKSLTLDFHGERIWMLPEGKKLWTSFNKLTKMFIHGIYVNFGLLWTITLLGTAPSLKTFGIELWNHVCENYSEATRRALSERINPWQNSNKINGSRHLRLRTLEFVGFMATKKHVQFIRGVMDYAPNLETIVLQDKDPCKFCDAVNSHLPTSSRASMFPKKKYKQDMLLNQLRDGMSRSTQIMFK